MGQRVEDNLNRLLRRTHTLIERERDTIMRLAHALEEHKTLAGEDVVAVIELRPGTRVDGAQYADPEFMEQIEDYHSRMLAAHQQGVQRIEFDPPVRTALVGALAQPAPAGNGHTPPVAPNGHGEAEPTHVDVENGQVAFVDHNGEAIIGPGTSQLLRADHPDDEEEQSSAS
jgi:hypothetical protein